MYRRITACALICIIILTTTGCWGKRELNEIGIVTATGIDMETDGKIRITVLAIVPLGGGQMGAMEKSNTWIGTAIGSDLSSAWANLNSIAVKRLVWFHNKIVVISEDVARAGVKNIVDFLVRNREFRYESNIMITDRKAQEMLLIPADIENNIQAELSAIEDNIVEWAGTHTVDFKDFLVGVADENKGIVTGKVSFFETDRDTFSTSREMRKRAMDGEKKLGVAILEGAAVLKGHKMVGWMDDDETRGYLWVRGEVRGGNVTAEGSDGMISMEVHKVDSKVTSDVSGEKINFHVEVNIMGTINEQTSGDDLTDEQEKSRIEQMLAMKAEDEMRQVVRKAQEEFRTDIFGFGDIVFMKHPKLWRQIGDKWGAVFPEVQVDYRVNVTIKRFGMITKPVF